MFRCLPELSALGTGVVLARGSRLRADWDLPQTPVRVSRVNRSLLCSNSVLHSSLMIRRDVMMGVGAYDERRMAQFDYDLLLRTRAAGYLIGQCNLPLVLHRLHAAQYFEGLQPLKRAWSSCRLQLDNIARERSSERFVYYGVAMVRLALPSDEGHRLAPSDTSGHSGTERGERSARCVSPTCFSDVAGPQLRDDSTRRGWYSLYPAATTSVGWRDLRATTHFSGTGMFHPGSQGRISISTHPNPTANLPRRAVR